MADFCSNCSERLGFDYTFDLEEIVRNLKPGYVESLFCEGCGMEAIARQKDGTLIAMYWKNKGNWVPYIPDEDLV